MRVKCLTLNLKGLEEWHDDRDQLAVAGLSKLQADVIFLQEVVIQQDPFFYHQMDFLADSLRLENRCFSPYGNDVGANGNGQKGIAVLSRWPITSMEVHSLPPGGPQDKRSAIFARIQGPSGSLQTINTHLSWEPEKSQTRLSQMRTLLKYLDHVHQQRGDLPLILAGDMNAAEQDAAIREARKILLDSYRHLHPDDPGFTWVRSNPRVGGADKYLPDRRVDYIFCNQTILVHQAEIVLDQPGFVSDHFGILADLEWKT